VSQERTGLGVECDLVVRIVVDTLDDIHFSGLVRDRQFIYRQDSVERINYVWPLAIPQQPI